jgi:hypothetical protein
MAEIKIRGDVSGSTTIKAPDSGSDEIIELSSALGSKRDKVSTVNAQTGTTYTLATADITKIVTVSNANAITVTVPTNAADAIPIGSELQVTNISTAANATIVGAGGVTVQGGAQVLSPGSSARLVKLADDVWAMQGASPPGLTLITSESFSAVSSLSVNGCFTSTYRNYRLVLNAASSGSSVELDFRFRASGSDDLSSEYVYARANHPIFTGGGLQYETSGNVKTSFARLYPISGTGANVVQTAIAYDIFGANDNTLYKTITGLGIYSDNITNNARFGPVTAQMAVTTAFDGFTIFPSSGTMSGIVSVYGYRK